MMTTGYKYLELLIKSESGRRAIKILPQLSQAKDLDEFLLVRRSIKSIFLYICMYLRGSIYLPIYLSLCLSINLSIYVAFYILRVY